MAEVYNFCLPSTMAGALCSLLASLLAFIAYMGIMHFFFNGEAAVAILPHLALAIAATVYSSRQDPLLVPRSLPTVGVRASLRGSIRAVIVVVVLWIPGAVAVCSTCYGQLPNCLGGATCPLAVLQIQNAAILAGSAAAASKGADLLHLRVLRVVTQNVTGVLKTIVIRVALQFPATSLEDLDLPYFVKTTSSGAITVDDAEREILAAPYGMRG
eukprot:3716525-Pleurochrysis_carterae.AAC.1